MFFIPEPFPSIPICMIGTPLEPPEAEAIYQGSTYRT